MSSSESSDQVVKKKKTVNRDESSSSSSPPPTKKVQTPSPPPVKKVVQQKARKIEYSDSDSSSDEHPKKSVAHQNNSSSSQNLRASAPVDDKKSYSIVGDTAKVPMERLRKIKDKVYTVKIDDTYLMIDAIEGITINLFSISQGKADYHISKKLIIKGLRPMISHRIICGSKNCFDNDKTKKELTIVGTQTLHLQSGGDVWYIMS